MWRTDNWRCTADSRKSSPCTQSKTKAALSGMSTRPSRYSICFPCPTMAILVLPFGTFHSFCLLANLSIQLSCPLFPQILNLLVLCYSRPSAPSSTFSETLKLGGGHNTCAYIGHRPSVLEDTACLSGPSLKATIQAVPCHTHQR